MTTNNQLKSIVDRIESLEQDKREIANDIKEVYHEAKGNGFDTKVIRKIIARRKRNISEVLAEEAILDTYMSALGMLADTPLGKAAMARDGITA